MLKKKLFATVLLFILVFASVTPVYAIQLPLELSARRATFSPVNNITLVSFHANLRIRTGFTSVNTSMIIRNDGLSDANILVGVPSQMDSIVTVKQISVVIEGKAQKFVTRRSVEHPDYPDIFMPPRWSTFSIKLGPGESKVIESAYTIDNKIGEFGEQTIYFPLSYLKFWGIPINYLQIVADLDFYPPYVFEPNPSIMPLKYEGGGRLLWQLTDVKEPQDIVIHFNPVEISIVNYLKQQTSGNKAVNSILALFEGKDYDTAINEITDFLASNPDFELKTELEYIKALCHLALFQPGMALDIFNRIENNPGFGSQLSNAVRNKIIYDKVFLLGLRDNDEEILEYLKQVQPTLKNNIIFSNWVGDEIDCLTPPPVIEEPVETPDEPEQPEPEEERKTNSIKTIESIEIFGYDVPLEILVIGILALIIIIYIIRSRKRKKRRRYLF